MIASVSDIAADPDRLLVVIGPTASGKTEVSLRLAERLGGEIIGADSVQIYRRFDAGSGKPSPADRARVPHHLIDVADPIDAYDAQRFVETAERDIAGVRARGAVPIVCGGTFLWVRALVRGLSPVPAADASIRARHEAMVIADGRDALHHELSRVDPVSAARLLPNDVIRVSRALEIFELSGKPASTWFAEHGFRTVRNPARLVGVLRSREALDERIAARTTAWLRAGWVEEVKHLLDDGLRSARAMGSVGYRQVVDHLDGKLGETELGPAIVRATRVLVRRQRTWLRDEDVVWVNSD